MYFSEADLITLRKEKEGITARRSALEHRFKNFNFDNQVAEEFALHGFVRRTNILARCIENVFSLIPPEQVKPVPEDILRDAEINIQTSMFNVFAAVENLAWVWVCENKITKEDGKPLPKFWIGLRDSNKFVRDTLPIALQDKLSNWDSWFKVTDEYRHALAHQIPLYIPPFCIDPANEDEYQRLEQAKIIAKANGDELKFNEITDKQKLMQFFRPWMRHSLSTNKPPLVFHPQLLQNFLTIEELGMEILDALQMNKGT